jgi:hypothetical protein
MGLSAPRGIMPQVWWISPSDEPFWRRSASEMSTNVEWGQGLLMKKWENANVI